MSRAHRSANYCVRGARVTPSESMNDAEIEAAVWAELPWLLERRQVGERAAAEDTVSGRLRRAVKHMRQPYEQVCQATGISFEQLADFMAGGVSTIGRSTDAGRMIDTQAASMMTANMPSRSSVRYGSTVSS